MGDSEKQVKNIFQVAREKARSIVFIDEIDSLCGKRGENDENESSRRIKSELLVHMQDVCDGVENVLILAATNTPSALDQAIRRRFDKRIYVPLPDPKAREQILKNRIGETRNNISDKKFDDLVKDTDGFSGSDISYFVKDALYEVVRETLTNEFFKRSGEKLVPCKSNDKERVSLQEIDERGENLKIEVPPSTAKHFTDVLKDHKATVTKDDLDKFDEFTKMFGIKG